MMGINLRWRFAVAVSLFLVASGARADAIVLFMATPTDVSGPAGTTVGWGYTITNNTTTDYLDISDIDSDLSLATDGVPDASIFNFPNLAPGETATQDYDPGDDLGLFQFTWNSDVATGTTETGTFTIYGALCGTTDPYCADDGSVTSTVLASADYSVTVAPATVVPTPEPSALAMLVFGMAALGGLRWRLNRRLDACRLARRLATTS